MKRFRAPRLISLFMLAILPLVLSPGTVLAHGYLIRSIPEEGAVLERSPSRIQYWFSEGLEADFSSLTVRNQQGSVVAQGGLSAENNALLTARLPNNLPDGAYIVDMRIAFASDGHVIAQSRVFFIGTAVDGIRGENALNQANLLEVIWRVLSLSSTMLLFGVTVLYTAVLIPAWGNRSYRAGLLPPRVMSTLNRVMMSALVVAYIGNILALLQQSMVFFETDLTRVITQNLWGVVRASTRFGDLWSARMILLILVTGVFALSLYLRKDQPETVRPFWAANAWALLLLIGTFSAGSHAAGSIIWPWVATFNDWLHGIGVGLWVGGVAALTLVLPGALAPYSGEPRRQALLAVMQRLSRIATACLLLVIATGIYSASTWIYAPADLTSTNFGLTLSTKVIMVASLVGVGFLHYSALRPERYARFQAGLAGISRFIPTLRIESLLALAVLISVGFLSATPVPIPYFIQEGVPAPTSSQVIDDFNISLALTPGGPGVNTYDARITRAGQPVDHLNIRLQMVNPNRDMRGAWETLESAENGTYIGVGADITRAGIWWALVDLYMPDQTIQRAAFTWQITDEAAVQQTQPPRLQHVFALMLVLAAVGWALYPFGRTLYHRLDLNAANVTIVIGAVIGTILLILMGVVIIQNTGVLYDQTLNPIPSVMNTVIPDQASLERGQTLYTASCPAWEQDARFVERLARIRDEQLFNATREGWQGSPACSDSLSEDDRWAIVNYIRTFQR